ncbi:MAG: hypothetical protein NC132_04660 [Corallococcus sp.]|nr:hypothetical protein [Corallococcus sp.]MCM1359678.1 hypothetical protein [Corallococcus sp.]MCM1395387.1 hypothetical protein [Corallococcus sp.]
MDNTNVNAVRSVQSVHEEAKAFFSDWIRINDDQSKWTIEDFSYKDGVPDKVENHCWKCITVNHCWFVDEVDKKPQEFDYGRYTQQDVPQSKRGLYHPNCHCKKLPIRNPQPSDIQLIETEGKIDYMWKSKLHLYHLCGYADDEKEYFENLIAQKTKDSYVSGNYECEKHDKYGYKINCIFKIPSKNPKLGKEIEMWSNWMIFPDGTLKCNSYFGGMDKK